MLLRLFAALRVRPSGTATFAIMLFSVIVFGNSKAFPNSVVTDSLSITLPTNPPETLSLTVQLGDRSVQLALQRRSVRSENFQILLVNAAGDFERFDPGPVRTYQGRLTRDPDSTVRALLGETGLHAWILEGSGAEWRIEPRDDGFTSSHIASSASTEFVALHTLFIEDAIEASGFDLDEPPPASRPGDPPLERYGNFVASSLLPAALGDDRRDGVRRAEVGFDVDYRFYSEQTASNPATLRNALEHYVNDRLNFMYVRDALIEHVIGRVIVRSNLADDPYRDVSDGNRRLEILRDTWNALPSNQRTHDLAHLAYGANGGGLAWVGTVCGGSRYSTGSGRQGLGLWRGYARHEFSHSWSLSHSHRGCPEKDNNDRTFGVMCPPETGVRMHSLEVDSILSHRNSRNCLVDIGPYPEPIRPYAFMDEAFAASGGEAVRIDVVANDHDANCDVLSVASFDSRSERGATITRSRGTGPGGRDEILYTPPESGSGLDRFQYVVADGTGLSFWGNVHVRLIDIPQASIPGRIEFENYDTGGPGVSFNDTTDGNSGGDYRVDDVDVRATDDAGGGYRVGWIAGREWLEYTVDVRRSAYYSFGVRAATPQSGRSLDLSLDGEPLARVTLEKTGSFGVFATSVVSPIWLPAGSHRLRATMRNSNFDLNWIDFHESERSDVSDDVHVLPGDQANDNFGRTPLVEVPTDGAAYLRFRLDDVDPSLSRALLTLHTRETEGSPSVTLRSVGHTWRDLDLAYSNRPPAGDALGSYFVPGSDRILTMDVTAAVIKAAAEGIPFAVEITSDAYLSFDSEEGEFEPTILLEPDFSADSAADWRAGDTQPDGDWEYGWYERGAGWRGFEQFTVRSVYFGADSFIGGAGQIWDHPDGYPRIGRWSMHPYANGNHGEGELFAVRRWTSPVTGWVTIHADVAQLHDSVDDQTALITRKGQPLWHQPLSDETRSANVRFAAWVREGDAIDFAVDPNGQTNADWTYFWARIEPYRKVDSDLLAHWTCDKSTDMPLGGSSDEYDPRLLVHDDSGNGNHAELRNLDSTQAWSDGAIGGSLGVDGVGDARSSRSDIGDGARELTLSAWVYPTGRGAKLGIVSNSSPNSSFFSLKLEGDRESDPVVFRAMNVDLRSPAGVISLDEWSHVVGVWKSESEHTLYVNGRVVATNPNPPAGEIDVNHWYLGSDRGFDGRYLIGRVDDVGIWAENLEEHQVASLWLCGQGGRNLQKSADCEGSEEGGYRRGDVNTDERVDLTDAVSILQFLFTGGAEPGCLASADSNDSGGLELTDAIYLLSYLFLGGEAPPSPFESCGIDPTPDPLSCELYSLCQGPSWVHLVQPTSPASYLVPDDNTLDLDWTEAQFDDSNWQSSRAAIGYDEADTYDALIESDVGAAMNGVGTSIYLRAPFEVRSPESHRVLVLRVQYDDGFVAYLNGQRIASKNAPDTLGFDSSATTTHDDALAIEFENFEILVPASRLRTGQNVLSFHGLNASLGSSDFLLSFELNAFR